MNKIKRALREIAKREGMSAKQVYHEMQAAIDAGFHSHDPAVQAVWREVPALHGKPRPEDVVKYCVHKVR